MSKVYVGGISPEGERILTSYLNEFMPDAELEPLRVVGIKGKMRNFASRPDVVLVIIDEALYQTCVGVVDDVLSLPKVHKYITDDGLNQFLIRWFGKLSSDSSTSVEPTQSVSSYSTVQDDDIFTQGDSSTNPVNSEEIEKKESEIEDLRDRLTQSELMVKNLALQLEDSKSGSDVSMFVERIKELEEQVRAKSDELKQISTDSFVSLGKVSKAEQVLDEINSLKAELKTAKEDCSEYQYKLNTAITAKDTVEKQLTDATTKLEELNGLKTKLAEVSGSLAEMTVKYSKLEATVSDTEVLESKLSAMTELEQEVAELKSKLSEKELEIKNLATDLEDKSDTCTSLLARIDELKLSCDKKEEELSSKELEYNSILIEKDTLFGKVEALQESIKKLNDTIQDLQDGLKEKSIELDTEKKRGIEQERSFNEKIAELESNIEEVDDTGSRVSELQTKLSSCARTIEDLRKNVADLEINLEAKEGEVSAYKQRDKAYRDAQLKLAESISEKEEKASELEIRLDTAIKENDSLKAMIDTLRNSTESAQNSINEQLVIKDAELEEATNKAKKLENEITVLKTSILDTRVDSETVSKLNADLLEERRKNARVTSELEVFKSSSDLFGVSAETTNEIKRLEAELEELKNNNSTISTETFNKLKEENTDMKLTIADQEETLDELQNGIFGQMANVAMPRLAYDIKLIVPEKLKSRCVCIASGSTESNVALYQTLRRTCLKNKNTKYLIVDLVTDSAIDSTFGVAKIASPRQWLTGTSKFTEFVSSCSIPNVRVISTAFAYFNDLSLLLVDWEKRIDEIQDSNYVVVFNVGCLSNLVSKILYCSFTQIMSGNIIVKASPVNLRTAYLMISGYKVINNTVMVCVDFAGDSMSNTLYQKLTQKCQSQILKTGDVMYL